MPSLSVPSYRTSYLHTSLSILLGLSPPTLLLSPTSVPQSTFGTPTRFKASSSPSFNSNLNPNYNPGYKNYTNFSNTQNQRKESPLHWAAEGGDNLIVKFLLKNGADPSLFCLGERKDRGEKEKREEEEKILARDIAMKRWPLNYALCEMLQVKPNSGPSSSNPSVSISSFYISSFSNVGPDPSISISSPYPIPTSSPPSQTSLSNSVSPRVSFFPKSKTIISVSPREPEKGEKGEKVAGEKGEKGGEKGGERGEKTSLAKLRERKKKSLSLTSTSAIDKEKGGGDRARLGVRRESGGERLLKSPRIYERRNAAAAILESQVFLLVFFFFLLSVF